MAYQVWVSNQPVGVAPKKLDLALIQQTRALFFAQQVRLPVWITNTVTGRVVYQIEEKP